MRLSNKSKSLVWSLVEVVSRPWDQIWKYDHEIHILETGQWSFSNSQLGSHFLPAVSSGGSKPCLSFMHWKLGTSLVKDRKEWVVFPEKKWPKIQTTKLFPHKRNCFSFRFEEFEALGRESQNFEILPPRIRRMWKFSQLLTPLKCLPKRWTASNLQVLTTKHFPFQIKERSHPDITVEQLERWSNPPHCSPTSQWTGMYTSCRFRNTNTNLQQTAEIQPPLRWDHSNPEPNLEIGLSNSSGFGLSDVSWYCYSCLVFLVGFWRCVLFGV